MRLPGTIGWFLHRTSGAVLFLGLLLHFYIMHFAGTVNLSHEAVMARFQSPCWIGFNAVFLLSAVYHGVNGLWGIAIEYLRGEPMLRNAKVSLSILGVALVAVGLYILTIR